MGFHLKLDPSQDSQSHDDFHEFVQEAGLVNFLHYGLENEPARERSPTDPYVEVIPPPPFLTEQEHQTLCEIVPVGGMRDDDDLGLKPYLAAVNLIGQLLKRRS